MKSNLTRLMKILRAVGLRQAFWFGVYQIGLYTGHYRRVTPPQHETGNRSTLRLWIPPEEEVLSHILTEKDRSELRDEVEEIIAGQVRLYGGPPVPLVLTPPGELRHWTEYELGHIPWGTEDIKDIWEPARFGWVFPLGRLYLLTRDERCSETFWRNFETFDHANPPNLGQNWTSGQEVALRLVGLLFAASMFANSDYTTPPRAVRLAQSIAEHAARIPPTLPYAKAQNNNHLVSEALGLYVAGVSLPDHHDAKKWRELGWNTLNLALQKQIATNGTYVQHSTNYHRLVLQAALLADCFARVEGRAWPGLTLIKLHAATRWMRRFIDPTSGKASNLGHNDGAYILPLAGGGFAEYRPTIQAAARAFGGFSTLMRGPWDELSLWLGQLFKIVRMDARDKEHLRLFTPDHSGWASMRGARFRSRPAHADQLHVEIWHRGVNVAKDAGTYRYTAPASWENALASTLVHNTVTVDGRDQMTRAGKFLWLDWAQGRVELGMFHPDSGKDAPGQKNREDEFPWMNWIQRQVASGERDPNTLQAGHDGYLSLGVLHNRFLHREDGPVWEITDQLLPGAQAAGTHVFTLHWLLPDWPHRLEGSVLTLTGAGFDVRVEVSADAKVEPVVQLIRAGEALVGPPADSPIFGWASPTYSVRVPALSLRYTWEEQTTLTIQTVFTIKDAG